MFLEVARLLWPALDFPVWENARFFIFIENRRRSIFCHVQKMQAGFSRRIQGGQSSLAGITPRVIIRNSVSDESQDNRSPGIIGLERRGRVADESQAYHAPGLSTRETTSGELTLPLQVPPKGRTFEDPIRPDVTRRTRTAARSLRGDQAGCMAAHGY